MAVEPCNTLQQQLLQSRLRLDEAELCLYQFETYESGMNAD